MKRLRLEKGFSLDEAYRLLQELPPESLSRPLQAEYRRGEIGDFWLHLYEELRAQENHPNTHRQTLFNYLQTYEQSIRRFYMNEQIAHAGMDMTLADFHDSLNEGIADSVEEATAFIDDLKIPSFLATVLRFLAKMGIQTFYRKQSNNFAEDYIYDRHSHR